MAGDSDNYDGLAAFMVAVMALIAAGLLAFGIWIYFKPS